MIGAELGKYRIVETLGKGGMGRVYVGEHTLLGRRAAIKVLDQRFDQDETVKTRFFNEARAISRLKHPSIVEIYDFGHSEDGAAYLVMELLAGEPLGRRMKRGVMPTEHTIIFCRQVASALAVAHEHGVVHRDLKPDNIFIERDPEVEIGERAKVLDFGVAKQPKADERDEDLTKAGVLLGTPAYMSPEQIDGREVTYSSDIYSLGVVMYRMLTGTLPFAAADQQELLGMHLHSDPTPPSQHNPRIPPALEQIVLRCLAKRPEDRFENMQEVAESLGALHRLPSVPQIPEDPSEFHAIPTDVNRGRRRSTILPLPAPPEETGVHTPAPSAPPPLDDPSSLSHSAGETSAPFDRVEPAGRNWGAIAGITAAALLLGGLVIWGVGGDGSGQGDSDPRKAATPGPGPAPIAKPELEPAIVTPDAAPAPAVATQSPDAAPEKTVPKTKGSGAFETRKQETKAPDPFVSPVAKPKLKRPKKQPKRDKQKRKDFEKPVF